MAARTVIVEKGRPRKGWRRVYLDCTTGRDRGQDSWPSKMSLDPLTATQNVSWPWPLLCRSRRYVLATPSKLTYLEPHPLIDNCAVTSSVTATPAYCIRPTSYTTTVQITTIYILLSSSACSVGLCGLETVASRLEGTRRIDQLERFWPPDICLDRLDRSRRQPWPPFSAQKAG